MPVPGVEWQLPKISKRWSLWARAENTPNDLDDRDVVYRGPELLLEAVVWVLTAAASGMLGNMAHELAKAAVARLKSEPKKRRRAFTHDDALLLSYQALLACLIDQGRIAGVTIEDLSKIQSTFDTKTRTWTFVLSAPNGTSNYRIRIDSTDPPKATVKQARPS